MGQKFNAKEMLEIASQIEKNGANFYRTASGHVTDPKSQKALHLLAEMEDGHEQLFETMLNDEDDKPIVISTDDSQATYLRAIADNHVFISKNTPDLIFPKDADELKVFQISLQAELASIAFFSEVHEQMPDSWGREKVKKIIEEEKQHVVLINQMIENCQNAQTDLTD